jgi:hypothetical protein
MKNKYQSFLGGRVGEARIETTEPDSNNKFLENMLVLIRPATLRLPLRLATARSVSAQRDGTTRPSGIFTNETH